MAIWLAMLIPFFFTFVTWVGWGKRVTWWELFVPTLVSFFVILGFKSLGDHVELTDTEYWTGYVEKAEYYEPWDETVPCTHVKYKTVTKTRPKTKTNSKGQTVSDGVETYTEQVPDGHLHAYDVDYHPASYSLNDNTGHSESISAGEFERLCQKFNNRQFANLHRNFHSINGNKYFTTFDNSDEKLEPCTHTHDYENRIRVSTSVFKFRNVDKDEKENLKLFDYPTVSNYKCPAILGYSDPQAEQKLAVLNARLGKPKQIRVWITVYRGQAMQAAFAQQAYWQGGNKNELVLAVGIDDQDIVQWGQVYSWSDREDLKIECRDKIEEQENHKINLSKLIDDVRPMVEKNWERKHFKEFNYLEVETPGWCIWTAYGITLLSNIGLALWVVKNGVDAK